MLKEAYSIPELNLLELDPGDIGKPLCGSHEGTGGGDEELPEE